MRRTFSTGTCETRDSTSEIPAQGDPWAEPLRVKLADRVDIYEFYAACHQCSRYLYPMTGELRNLRLIVHLVYLACVIVEEHILSTDPSAFPRTVRRIMAHIRHFGDHAHVRLGAGTHGVSNFADDGLRSGLARLSRNRRRRQAKGNRGKCQRDTS